MPPSRTRVSNGNGVPRDASRSDRVAGEDRTTAYLLIQLRRANRTILRLRACALAARDGDGKALRVALAALRPRDLRS